jgi:hypothetical protein
MNTTDHSNEYVSSGTSPTALTSTLSSRKQQGVNPATLSPETLRFLAESLEQVFNEPTASTAVSR